MQGSGKSLCQWSDRVLTLATRAFPQLMDVHAQAIPGLCYRAEDKDAEMYALEGQPKTVEEAVDRMQFFQHSRQGRLPKPKREVRAVAPEEKPQGTGDGRPSREIRELQSRIKELERALQERTPVQPNPPRTTSPPRAAAEGRRALACFKCGEMGHYRRNCPRNSGAKETGNTGEDEGRPQRSRGPIPQTKGADGQRPGTGDRAPRGHKMVRVLTPERNEPTATPQDPMVFAPICPDCESDPPDSDSAGF